MNQYIFNVSLTYNQFLPIYEGAVDKIIVTDTTGRTIELPASHFKPYLTPDGISGKFKLITEKSGKFNSLTRIF